MAFGAHGAAGQIYGADVFVVRRIDEPAPSGGTVIVGIMGIACSRVAGHCPVLGIPVPGETTLIASAIYGGSFHKLSVWVLITAAIGAAVAGNVIGYWLGRLFGYRILVRYGSYVRLPEPRLKIGQYLFHHYGIAVVVIARFVPLLRSMAPILVGANLMELRPFLAATLASAVAWIMFDGVAAFYIGLEIIRLSTTAMILVGVLVALVITAIAVLITRHESQLQIKAEKEIPGPLPQV